MKKITTLLICLLTMTVVSAQQYGQYRNQEDSENADLVIYPNPTSGVVYIEHIRPVTEIIVSNILGQIIDRFETNRNQHYVLDLSELRNGMYFIRVTDEGNTRYIQKLIKK